VSANAPRLILASGSPRRRELLAQAGFEFETIEPGVREVSPDELTIGEITFWNAIRKGLAVARKNPDAVVLAADTLVALGGAIIGKPQDLAEARKILARLNGREHIVATGVFLAWLAHEKTESFVVFSRVFFRKWSDAQIENYLREINPLDKAGAYAAQDRGGAIIRRITHSRSNVIGLPLEKLRPALARFGVTPTKPNA
jgi:septum formation protein